MAFTVNGTEEDVPPAGVVFTTVMAGVPAEEISPESIAAVSCPVFT